MAPAGLDRAERASAGAVVTDVIVVVLTSASPPPPPPPPAGLVAVHARVGDPLDAPSLPALPAFRRSSAVESVTAAAAGGGVGATSAGLPGDTRMAGEAAVAATGRRRTPRSAGWCAAVGMPPNSTTPNGSLSLMLSGGPAKDVADGVGSETIAPYMSVRVVDGRESRFDARGGNRVLLSVNRMVCGGSWVTRRVPPRTVVRVRGPVAGSEGMFCTSSGSSLTSTPLRTEWEIWTTRCVLCDAVDRAGAADARWRSLESDSWKGSILPPAR